MSDMASSLLNRDPTEWLLAAEPWTRYRTLVDLVGRPSGDDDVTAARRDLVTDPRVADLVETTSDWFPVSAKRHDDAKLSHYGLMVLGEFGLQVSDPGMEAVATQAARHFDGAQFEIRALAAAGPRFAGLHQFCPSADHILKVSISISIFRIR